MVDGDLHRTGLDRPALSPTTTLARQIRAGLNRARFSSLAQRGGQVGGGSFFQSGVELVHGLNTRFFWAAKVLNRSQQSFIVLINHVQIPLTQGLFALVSEEDAESIACHKWHAVKARATHYAARWAGGKTIYMHRHVIGLVDAPRSVFVDHINHNGLDNRRENLRQSSARANAKNRRCAPDYEGMRGIRQAGDAWEAQINVEGRLVYLGCFPSKREAGIAFSAASRVLGRNTI